MNNSNDSDTGIGSIVLVVATVAGAGILLALAGENLR